MSVQIRTARTCDDSALAALDRQCWSVIADVAPPRPLSLPFFNAEHSPDDILVAARHGAVIGWAKLRPPTSLASNVHVQQLQGLGVHPDVRGTGIARGLLSATFDLARSRATRKICLRVLSTNAPALSLYRSVGFAVEGILADEFFLDGQFVDDILMARSADANS